MMKRIILALALFSPLAVSAQNSYGTNFPIVENPISESGHWISGSAAGTSCTGNPSNLCWGDVRTMSGTGGIQQATGTIQNGSSPFPFSDSTAILSGTWNPNQMASAVVHIANQQSAVQEEVELRLRTAISPGNITGYEFDASVDNGGATYLVIVRWNGGPGNFCYLTPTGTCENTFSPTYANTTVQINNGDTLKAIAIGTNPTTLTLFVNGVQKLQRTDTGIGGSSCTSSCVAGPFTNGSPGMGFWDTGSTALFANFGFSSFYATDALGTILTAASCGPSGNPTDVSAKISAAVNGDIVFIPAGSCTWTSGITLSGKGITIIGSGVPNSSPNTNAASASCASGTIITDHLTSGNSLFTMTPTVGNATSRISCLDILPFTPTSGYGNPINVNGICTVGGCPNLRLDNLTIPNTWAGTGISASAIGFISNVFGVADHNSIGDVQQATSYVAFLNIGHGSWQGVGLWGDNSWASPDTFGTTQAFYLENNTFKFTQATDTVGGMTDGGARIVCRFNVFNPDYIFGGCTGHGTDTSGRSRGIRQWEIYDNTANCQDSSGQGCGSFAPGRSGVGRHFENALSDVSTGRFKGIANFDAQRTWRFSNPWGFCDGKSPWDQNDDNGAGTNVGNVWFSGTIGSVSGAWKITDSGAPGWSLNQWAPSGSPYSFYDVTGNFSYALASNDATSITTQFNAGGGTPVAVHSYQILRAFACMDQSTRSGGQLIQDQLVNISTYTVSAGIVTVNSASSLPSGFINNASVSIQPSSSLCSVSAAISNVTATSFKYPAPGSCTTGGSGGTATAPVLVSTGLPGSTAQVLDPSYEAADILPTSTAVTHTFSAQTTMMIPNRDWYAETDANPVGGPGISSWTNQTAQTSASAPFNGSTCSPISPGEVCGTGHGLLSRRPTTCTTGVGYWATDQGTWNTSTNLSPVTGLVAQGQLYICTSTNTWTLSYTPFAYPHPLISGAASAFPVAVFTPSAVNAGQVPLGLTGNPVSVTFQNTGTANLVNTSITLSNANFTIVSNTCGSPATITNLIPGTGFTLAPSASCTFSVTATPSVIGGNSANAVFTENTLAGFDTLILSGNGTGPPAPATIMFAGTLNSSGTVKLP